MNKIVKKVLLKLKENLNDDNSVHFDSILEFTRDIITESTNDDFLELIKWKPEVLLHLKDAMNCGLHDMSSTDSMELIRDTVEYWIAQTFIPEYADRLGLTLEDR